MSYSFVGNRVSYPEYIMAHEFVEDMKSTSRDSTKQVCMSISRQTREVIASNEALSQDNIRATELAADKMSAALNSGFSQISSDIQDATYQITTVLDSGFENLSYRLQDISSGISDLKATFHWGFGQMLAGIDRMNDTLNELLRVAKTPAQTAAYEQYQIARDAYRQGLYFESIESLDRAINGDQASTGYKLDWRFHQMKGTMYLGFVGCEQELIDLAKAEDSFLLAARYAKTDFPDHAGQAYLSAGWAAYCQGRMKEALAHTEQAISVNPKMGEAFFQAAKVKMALNEVENALPELAKAIEKDRFFALKAAGDGDFQRFDTRLREYLVALRDEKYQQAKEKAEQVFEFQPIRKIKIYPDVLALIDQMKQLPLFDLMAACAKLDEMLADSVKSPITFTVTGVNYMHTRLEKYPVDEEIEIEEIYPVEETYMEEVTKPGGWFRKAVKEMQTKTRTVNKTRLVKSVHTVQKSRSISEEVKGKDVNFEFCFVPEGTLNILPDTPKGGRVSIEGFHIGKYLVTYKQWEAVMGESRSNSPGTSQPIEKISWDDCQLFITKLNSMIDGVNFRLPTTIEWRYAFDEVLNYDKKGQGMRKKQNALGLENANERLWEWCQQEANVAADSIIKPLCCTKEPYQLNAKKDEKYHTDKLHNSRAFSFRIAMMLDV